MVSFGSSFKYNSCVCGAVKDLEDSNVWENKIDNYPPKIGAHMGPSLQKNPPNTIANSYMKQYGWVVYETNLKPSIAQHEKNKNTWSDERLSFVGWRWGRGGLGCCLIIHQ